MNAIAKKTNATTRVCTHMGFGYFDAKGREIGAIATVYEFDLVAVEQGGDVWDLERYGNKFGRVFAGLINSARNGQSYGASQPTKYFSTEADRDAYLAKRWADSLKAAAKKAA